MSKNTGVKLIGTKSRSRRKLCVHCGEKEALNPISVFCSTCLVKQRYEDKSINPTKGVE